MSTDYTIPKGEYRDLLAERDRLEERCAQLREENAKLLQDRYERDDENLRLASEYMGALAQNEMLRELVRILYYCGLPWKDCDKCAMNGAEMHVSIDELQFCDGMHDRLYELGIEVE